MAGGFAVLLDTCYVRDGFSADDLLRKRTRRPDFFVSRGVLDEMQQFVGRRASSVRKEVGAAEALVVEATALAEEPAYQEVAGLVAMHEEDASLDPSPAMARLIHEAKHAPFRLRFERNRARGRLAQHLGALRDAYGVVMDALGVSVRVTQDYAVFGSPSAPERFSREMRVANQDDLVGQFPNYGLLVAARAQDVEQVRRRHVEFYRAEGVVNYFRQHSAQVVRAQQNPEVEKLASLTPKSVARQVYNRQYRGQSLSMIDVNGFVQDVNHALVREFTRMRCFSGSLASVLADAVAQTERDPHCRKARGRRDYVPSNHTDVDVDLVSTALAFHHLRPAYERVSIRTQDSDVAVMVAAYNALHPQTPTKISCDLVRRR